MNVFLRNIFENLAQFENQMNTFDWLTLHYIWKGNAEAVYHVIRRNGDASMSDFVAAFDGILTQKQVRNLIEGLCKTPLISSHGNARATKYSWV